MAAAVQEPDDVGVIQPLHQVDLGHDALQLLRLNLGDLEHLHGNNVARGGVQAFVHGGKCTAAKNLAELLRENVYEHVQKIIFNFPSEKKKKN